MAPQLGAVDKSATSIIHALIRNSKQNTWVREIDDLLNQQCMAHRQRYCRNDHALEIPHGHGRRGGTKAHDRAD